MPSRARILPLTLPIPPAGVLTLGRVLRQILGNPAASDPQQSASFPAGASIAGKPNPSSEKSGDRVRRGGVFGRSSVARMSAGNFPRNAAMLERGEAHMSGQHVAATPEGEREGSPVLFLLWRSVSFEAGGWGSGNSWRMEIRPRKFLRWRQRGSCTAPPSNRRNPVGVVLASCWRLFVRLLASCVIMFTRPAMGASATLSAGNPRGCRLCGLGEWRRGRDSNPWNLSVHWFSKPAQSTTLPPLRDAG